MTLIHVAEKYPEAEIWVVRDSLNTHIDGSFYERFEPEEVRKLCKKFEFHCTPKKASWLRMAEIGFSALSKQSLDRRIGDIEALGSEIKAWTEDRNGKRVKVRWRFTTERCKREAEEASSQC